MLSRPLTWKSVYLREIQGLTGFCALLYQFSASAVHLLHSLSYWMCNSTWHYLPMLMRCHSDWNASKFLLPSVSTQHSKMAVQYSCLFEAIIHQYELPAVQFLNYFNTWQWAPKLVTFTAQKKKYSALEMRAFNVHLINVVHHPKTLLCALNS